MPETEWGLVPWIRHRLSGLGKSLLAHGLTGKLSINWLEKSILDKSCYFRNHTSFFRNFSPKAVIVNSLEEANDA